MYLRGTDPFALFAEMQPRDAKLDPSHAFYLGYELAKAVTALTLGKNYTQDQALRWGFLTVPEDEPPQPHAGLNAAICISFISHTPPKSEMQ